MEFSRPLRAACIAVALSSMPVVSAADDPLVPVEAFSRLPRVEAVQLSPDGKHLAYLANGFGRSFLVMQTIGADQPKFLVRCENEKQRIRRFHWANDDWLLVSVSFASVRNGVPSTETRTVRVKREGSDPLLLFKPSLTTTHASQLQDGVISLLPDDPQHVLLALDDANPTFPSVYKVNIETGAKRLVNGSREPIRSWMTDQQDRVRLGVGYDNGVVSVHVRSVDKKKWRELWSHEAIAESGTEVLGFGADPTLLYVRELHEGRDAIFSIDLKDSDLTRTLLAHHPNYDIEGSLIYSPKTRSVVGVYDRGADGSRIYWDESYEALQDGLDRALPDTTNSLAAFSRDERRYIAYAFSDTSPGVFYYGDRDSGDLSPFGESYPELSEQKLSGKEPITYEARDGLMIEGYLTRPWGERSKPWPALVLPHGGPGVRDYGRFDYLTEFLASRGYAVLQMNFRGSSGYGWEFLKAGFQGLGGSMQDDVTDGANWLVQQEIADSKRLCILGGSYGGFVALYGAVKTPDLFRCAVSLNGVSDWAMVRAASRFYVTGESTKEQLGKRADLKQVSPLRRAGEIRIPVLLVHGEKDRVVPVAHSRKMAKALKKHGKVFRYLELENGVHSLENERNRTACLKAVESFLLEHLPRDSSATPEARNVEIPN